MSLNKIQSNPSLKVTYLANINMIHYLDSSLNTAAQCAARKQHN